ncbi:unnamed protein product [Citrullus colocynthis]|uniref:Uncharacterized protein n=1 Tax=Citrullus colocynthis TaxID=252529 RepID=A0ABP0Z4A1_9ROSI
MVRRLFASRFPLPLLDSCSLSLLLPFAEEYTELESKGGKKASPSILELEDHSQLEKKQEQSKQCILTINEKHSLVGDAFALRSAITDGLYYVLLEKYAGENGQHSKVSWLCWIVCFIWLMVYGLAAIGIEPKFGIPKSAKAVDIIVANCFLGNFVAD